MKKPSYNRPPRWGEWLLSRFVSGQESTLILGDLAEEYGYHYTHRGISAARRWYWHQVIISIPVFFFRAVYWGSIMWTHYLTIALRNMSKNKVSSIINIFGLPLAIGVSIIAFLNGHSFIAANDFHENGDSIFLVEPLIEFKGSTVIRGDSPNPLGPALEADFPQVERAVRMQYGGGRIQYENIALDDGICYADPGFFEMFTFPLKYGNSDALGDPDAVFMSEKSAAKYFGEENPIGQRITITSNGQVESFTVQGVAKTFPSYPGFSFNLLIHFDNQLRLGRERLDDWATFTRATFIQVKNPEDVETITSGMDRYTSLTVDPKEEWAVTGYRLDNLFNLVYTAQNVQNSISRHVPWDNIIVLSSIAGLLLLLSCFNFMNISLAAASRRLKEIGMRKVMGSTKQQLISQFMAENIMCCLLSLFLGIVIANFFLIPAFRAIGGGELALNNATNSTLFFFLTILLVGIGIVSGAYPAFYISSFQPVSILRGKQKIGGKNRFMHALLTFQFVLAFLTMIASVTFILNNRYLGGLDRGYNYQDTIYLQLQNSSQYTVMSSAVLQLPDVLSVSGSSHHVGLWNTSYGDAIVNGESMSTAYFDVDRNYLETVGIRLKTGRFIEDIGAVVINITFARMSGWTEPIGQTVRLHDTVYTVVGVLEDFHFRAFFHPVEPALFRLGDPSEYRFLTMRINPGTDVQTALALENIWQRLFPETPFEYQFQNEVEVFGAYFEEVAGIANLFTFIGIIALFISCMGLFGLAAQHIAGRMKEISIRKVLGASMRHVTRLANQQFLILLAIAALIATPLSYIILDFLLDLIFKSNRMPLGPSPFLIAYMLILITAFLTTAGLIYRVNAANPVEELRND